MAATSAPPSEAAASKSDMGSEASLDVSVLRELARKGLIDALNSVRLCEPCRCRLGNDVSIQVNGAKTLVLDPTLAGPLGLVTEVALLKVRTRQSPVQPPMF